MIILMILIFLSSVVLNVLFALEIITLREKVDAALCMSVENRIKNRELLSTLNKIVILGSGAKAYTSDFTNEVMGIARKALQHD